MRRDPQLLRSLIRLSDPQGPSLPLSALRPRGDQWEGLFGLADRHGVLGLVLHNLAIASRAGGESMTEAGDRGDPRSLAAALPGCRAASLAWRRQAAHTLALRMLGEELVGALTASGLRAASLKGADFAQHLYPQPGLRPARDIDILVRRADWPAASDLLRRSGYVEGPAQGGKHAAGDYGEACWMHPRWPAVAVELHWNLVNSPAQRRRFSLQFDDLEWQPAGGHPPTRPQPTPATRLLIAAVHAAIGHQFDRLLLLYDIQQACRKVIAAGAVWQARGLMVRTGTRPVMGIALAVAARLRRQLIGERTSVRARLISARTVLFSARPASSLRRRIVRQWLK